MKLNLSLGEIRRYRKKDKLLRSKVIKNPVQALGMDLPFLIVTSISLQAAAAISIELFFVHMGTVISALILCRFLPKWVRPLAYVAVSTIIMLLVTAYLIRVFPVVTDILGMYVYLMAVNGMTFAAAMSVEKEQKIYPVIANAFKGAAGFVVAMFVISMLREYFGSGSLWGTQIPHLLRMDGLLVPFFGFILVGFLLAGTRLLGKKVSALSVLENARREAVFKVVDVDS